MQEGEGEEGEVGEGGEQREEGEEGEEGELPPREMVQAQPGELALVLFHSGRMGMRQRQELNNVNRYRCMGAHSS